MKPRKWMLSCFLIVVASFSANQAAKAAAIADSVLPASVYDVITQQHVTKAYYYHNRYYPGTAYRHHRRVHRRVHRRYHRYY
jgi:hypothetical protein